MKAAIAIICGMLAFIIISGMQLNVISQLQIQNTLSPHIITIGTSTKLLVIALALTSITFSILYDKSGRYKMKILNKLGRILSIAAIIFILVPIYYFFK